LFDTAHIEWKWDDDQRQWHEFMKAMIHTRQENEALIDGDARFVETVDNLLAFYRQKVDEKVIVIINLSENPSKFVIPSEATFTKILGNATPKERDIDFVGYQFYIGNVYKPLTSIYFFRESKNIRNRLQRG
jgi:pullulanase/glycogen debranching enzyme